MTVVAKPLVQVEKLRKEFSSRSEFFSRRVVTAVDDVSFDIAPGETLSLVGESGSGKSTVGRLLVNLVAPTAGRIMIAGEDIGAMHGSKRKALWRNAQMVFQDPFSSLNPTMTIRDTLAEPLRNFNIATGKQADALIRDALEKCGLGGRAMELYPAEFSGGQRQRVSIARALILQPNFIVADEPVSALDVSIQAQIVNLLQDLQEQHGLTYLFISHDLAVVRHISSRVAVMYLGRIVEIATRADLYRHPMHPYTELLLRSVPIPDPAREAERIRTRPPDAARRDDVGFRGCAFAQRCPRAEFPLCSERPPELEIKASGRLAACHLVPRFEQLETVAGESSRAL
jgi:oligopeptide/dipeptide ABC transporter ATP-binding protein